MDFHFYIWTEYLIRFAHFVSGIAWIGSSFYFIWLDSHFTPPAHPRKNVDGELFMVHGGFYYQVEKKKIYPGDLPKILHWFKWEATLTWLTGFSLLVAVYYMRGASLLIDPSVYSLTQIQAILISLGLFVFSWMAYDCIWLNKWIQKKTMQLFLSGLLFIGVVYFNTQIFSARGAFIMTGAILGSLMLLNVWLRILPGQSKMLKEAQAGTVPDYSVGLKSKVRSVHNTYFTFPVLLIMISNHYPILYLHPKNWLVLIFLCIAGGLARHVMVMKDSKRAWFITMPLLLLCVLVYMTKKSSVEKDVVSSMLLSSEDLAYQQVEPIFRARCVSCHSEQPTDDVFKEPPAGLAFERREQIVGMKNEIYDQVVLSQIMPLGNKTKMTDEERRAVGFWLKSLR